MSTFPSDIEIAQNDSVAIDKVARHLAQERGFPLAMAGVNHGIDEME